MAIDGALARRWRRRWRARWRLGTATAMAMALEWRWQARCDMRRRFGGAMAIGNGDSDGELKMPLKMPSWIFELNKEAFNASRAHNCWKIQTASIATVLRNRRETCKRGLNMQWEQPELRAFRSGIPSAVTELEEVVASCVPHPDVANIPLSGHVGPISQRSMRSGTRLSIQQLPSSSASRRQGDFSIRSLFSRARNSNNSGSLTTTNF